MIATRAGSGRVGMTCNDDVDVFLNTRGCALPRIGIFDFVFSDRSGAEAMRAC